MRYYILATVIPAAMSAANIGLYLTTHSPVQLVAAGVCAGLGVAGLLAEMIL